MSDTAIVQRFTTPPGCQLLSLGRKSDDQACAKVRDIYKFFNPARPEDLDFSMSLDAIASFPDMQNWRVEQDAYDLPRIARARRQSERFLLIIVGGDGGCLIAEMLEPSEPLTAISRVRVHPYPLNLPLNQSLKINDISFGLSAGNYTDESSIEIVADPGVGPGGTALPHAPHKHLEPTSLERAVVLDVLDREILAWGQTFAATHKARLSGRARWPADLCRHVLPNKKLATKIARIVKAVAIRAYEKFAPDCPSELVVGLAVPNRPTPLAESDPYPWSVFVNLRNKTIPDAMQVWIEATLRTILDAKFPNGWYEIIGPDKSSRLGVQSQMPKTFATIRGPFSNHQRMEVVGVLGTLY